MSEREATFKDLAWMSEREHKTLREISLKQQDGVMSLPPSVIPFNRATFPQTSHDYLAECIAGPKHSGDGTFSKACHTFFEEMFGVRRALLTTSCTHALEMSALLLDIQPGDEVIVPSFTFVSTVNAFVLRGAHPVFCDVRPDTLNMDEAKLEALITPKTRAIVPVHYAGVGCEMDEIMAIAGRHDVPVVEDNAHGLFGKYRGKWLGSFGVMATQSFHETKNFSCGEGGALLINDEQYVHRAEIIREKGTNRASFFRGEVNKYGWVDVGSSYLSSDLLAALLLGQLEHHQQIQDARARIWRRYDSALSDWAAAHGVTRPHVPAHCDQAFHMYYLLMPSLEVRSRFITHMKDAGILAVFHYLPLHLSEYGVRFGGKPGDCPVTEDISDRLVRLPLFVSMSDEELERVIARVLAFSA